MQVNHDAQGSCPARCPSGPCKQAMKRKATALLAKAACAGVVVASVGREKVEPFLVDCRSERSAKVLSTFWFNGLPGDCIELSCKTPNARAGQS
eukprot:1143338-Pelagomonas_calceolata.AAC.4